MRPAGILCKEAMQYKSLITFRFGDDNTANAKSVLSVLGACIKCGDEIEFANGKCGKAARSDNPEVVGSSPSPATTKKADFFMKSAFFLIGASATIKPPVQLGVNKKTLVYGRENLLC